MDKRLTLFYGGLLTALAVVGLGINELRYNADKDPKVLYQEVSKQTDVNHDGNVTEAEWLTVYKSLDKPYDARHPSSLSIDDMRKYLKVNQ